MTRPDTTVHHVYGLVRGEDRLELPGTGIGGAPVLGVRVGPIRAVVSELEESDYGPDVWRAHADDPQWLGQVAAEHNAVLEWIVDRTDVLPLRLPGLYDDRAELEAALADQAEEFGAALAAVDGHVEWGVKVFLVQDAPPAATDTSEEPTSGRDYLLRKASEANRRQTARDERMTMLLDAHAELAESATHAVVNTPQDAALTGRQDPMLLNAAYLVARSERDNFLSLAEHLSERLWSRGMSVEVTGPWPPYNFAGRNDDSRTGSA